jgi:hypothetical protein
MWKSLFYLWWKVWGQVILVLLCPVRYACCKTLQVFTFVIRQIVLERWWKIFQGMSHLWGEIYHPPCHFSILFPTLMYTQSQKCASSSFSCSSSVLLFTDTLESYYIVTLLLLYEFMAFHTITHLLYGRLSSHKCRDWGVCCLWVRCGEINLKFQYTNGSRTAVHVYPAIGRKNGGHN